MKKLRCFYAGLIFLLLFVLSGLICSCESEPEPKLTEPIVTLMLSETSPQREVIISWTPSDDAESYSVERTMARDSISEERFFSWSSSDPLCSQDDGKFYLTDNTCEPGTEYTYVVTASAQRYVPITYETYSKSSKEKSITTAADPKVTLSYPKNVKVEPTTGKPNALTISWDAVSDALQYEIYYCSSWNSNFNELYKKAGKTSQTTYTMEHLGNTLHYYFMIKAIKGDEYSLFSAKADGRVADAENLSKTKALELVNGVEENLRSDSDELWFICKPQKGLLSIGSNDRLTVTIFDGEGKLITSGLPLFISGYEEQDDPNLTYIQEDEIIQRNIKNDISNFVPGNTYYLRIISADRSNYSICVE